MLTFDTDSMRYFVSIRRLSGDCKCSSNCPYDLFDKLTENRAFAVIAWPPKGRGLCVRVGIVQCYYDVSTGNGLLFVKLCITFLYKIVEPLNLYDNHTDAWPYGNGDTGSLQAS